MRAEADERKHQAVANPLSPEELHTRYAQSPVLTECDVRCEEVEKAKAYWAQQDRLAAEQAREQPCVHPIIDGRPCAGARGYGRAAEIVTDDK
jgi:hypothetical protein